MSESKTKPARPLAVGDKVRVRRYPRAIRTIEREYADIEGGVRLDRPVDGFVSWNVADLELVEAKGARAR